MGSFYATGCIRGRGVAVFGCGGELFGACARMWSLARKALRVVCGCLRAGRGSFWLAGWGFEGCAQGTRPLRARV